MLLLKMYFPFLVFILQGPLSAGVQGASLMVRTRLLSLEPTVWSLCLYS